jgi:hypothetical protein
VGLFEAFSFSGQAGAEEWVLRKINNTNFEIMIKTVTVNKRPQNKTAEECTVCILYPLAGLARYRSLATRLISSNKLNKGGG